MHRQYNGNATSNQIKLPMAFPNDFQPVDIQQTDPSAFWSHTECTICCDLATFEDEKLSLGLHQPDGRQS
jgi:hypothetical protein